MITIGSLFSGIGGLELGLERAIPNSKTIWQVEKNQFCRSILAKHWPDTKRYNDIRDFNKHLHSIQKPTIICGGFPCQSISCAGKKEGLSNADKSGLWYEMAKTISILRPRVILIENVSAIIRIGGTEIIRHIASLGYDAEWQTIRSAAAFGAPHIRTRWFCVAYPHSIRAQIQAKRKHTSKQKFRSTCKKGFFWQKRPDTPRICDLDNGFSKGLFRIEKLKALGNAVVPQSAEYIGRCILQSGLLD